MFLAVRGTGLSCYFSWLFFFFSLMRWKSVLTPVYLLLFFLLRWKRQEKNGGPSNTLPERRACFLSLPTPAWIWVWIARAVGTITGAPRREDDNDYEGGVFPWILRVLSPVSFVPLFNLISRVFYFFFLFDSRSLPLFFAIPPFLSGVIQNDRIRMREYIYSTLPHCLFQFTHETSRNDCLGRGDVEERRGCKHRLRWKQTKKNAKTSLFFFQRSLFGFLVWVFFSSFPSLRMSQCEAGSLATESLRVPCLLFVYFARHPCCLLMLSNRQCYSISNPIHISHRSKRPEFF